MLTKQQMQDVILMADLSPMYSETKVTKKKRRKNKKQKKKKKKKKKRW